MTRGPKFLRRYLVLLVMAAGCYVTICSVLEMAGTALPALRRDASVWGTYADWAGALFPAAAILVTIDLWSRDRTHASRLAAQPDLKGMSLEKKNGKLQFVYDSSVKIDELLTSEGESLVQDPRRGRVITLPDLRDEAVVVRVGSREWILEVGQVPVLWEKR